MAVVDMEQLKPNSHAYKEGLKNPDTRPPKEKMKPVVKNEGVVSTKKTIGRKFAETFIEEDVKDIKNYIIFDAIIPGVKNLILDVLSRMFFSEGYRGGGRSKGEGGYDYSAKYKYKSNSNSRRREREDRYEGDDKIDYRNIVLRRRDDAENIIDQLHDRIERYGSASIADLFDLIDVTGKYTDNNWGWDNARDIGLRRVSNGYLIDVAEAQLLD